MKKYLHYARRGLPWAICAAILYFILHRITTGEYESVLGYVCCSLLFIVIGGPFWAVMMEKFIRR